jgi:hypothetical protein
VRVVLLVAVLCSPIGSSAADAQSACSMAPASAKSAAELHAAATTSRQTALKLWVAANGASDAADRCEAVLWDAFGRLVALRNDAAAKLSADLLLDQKLSWDAGDALTVADFVARLGPLVRPYLEPHAKASTLAKFTLECIAEGRKSCH